MFSFFNRKKNNEEVPSWATFFNYSEYIRFIYEIEQYFSKLNIAIEISDGAIFLAENEFGFTNLGLSNVAQTCKLDSTKKYKEIINDHFNSLIEADKFADEFALIVDDFEEVKQYIAVRLYNENYIDHLGTGFTVGRKFEGDIYAMIVFDFPHSITNISSQQISKWGKTENELFEIGIKNIQNNYPQKITKENFGFFDIWFVNADHFFTPNIVFELENRKELAGSKGLLIGIPHRHTAIIYPIENLEVVKAMHGILPAVYNMNIEGPGSLSNKVFWYNKGVFTEIPYKIDDGKLVIIPPESFLNLLNELG